METTNVETVKGWFAGRLPEDWFTAAPEVAIEDDQIVVVGSLAEPKLAAGASAEAKKGAAEGRIARFREATRPHRIAIALEAERAFKLHVTWGAKVGDVSVRFNKGGSGRSQEGEAKGVMVGHRFGWHGRGRGRRGPWQRRASFEV